MLNIDKLSYSIGQVSELTEIAQSTLRYWETVILSLDPHKTDGGSRRYSKVDVEIVLKIKDLLYNQGFTIKGCNLFLNKQHNSPQSNTVETKSVKFNDRIESNTTTENNQNLNYIVDELKKIKNILE